MVNIKICACFSDPNFVEGTFAVGTFGILRTGNRYHSKMATMEQLNPSTKHWDVPQNIIHVMSCNEDRSYYLQTHKDDASWALQKSSSLL